MLDIPDDHGPWVDWLAALGYDTAPGAMNLLATEHERPAEHSVSAFLTDHAIEWLRHQEAPWFAHLSYLRPHPPYSAAGQWSAAYDPADVTLPIAPASQRHRMHDMVLDDPRTAAPADEAGIRHMRAQYYGMISEVDDQLGRVWDTLRELGMWDDTMIIVTSDHGEMLGDHGLPREARLLGAELPHRRHRPRSAPRRRARHGRRRVHGERRRDADRVRRDGRAGAGAVRRPAR